MVEYAPEGIFLYDSVGSFMDVNKEAGFMTGYKKEELIGKNFLTLGLLPRKYLEKFKELHTQNRSGQRTGPFDFELTRKDGSTITVEMSTFPVEIQGKVEVVSITRDITARKQMEERLEESEERFRGLFEGIQDPVCIVVGSEGRLLDYNLAFKKLFGYRDEELKDKAYLDFVHPDDRDMVLGKYRTTYSEEELPIIYEIRGLNKRGEAIPLEITVSTYKKKGRIIGIEVILREVTQRKRMEEELRESEERFRELYEGIHDPVAIYVGKEGRLENYNSAFKKLTGYTDEELKYKTFLDLTHPDDRAKVLEEYRTDYPEDKYPIIYELRGINKNGGTDYLEASVSPYKRRGKVIGVEVINRDITERKRMEGELRESEQRLRDLYESIPDGMAVYVGKEGHLLECNKAFKKHFGYTDEELKDKGFLDFIAPEDHAVLLREYRTDYPEEKLPFKIEARAINKNGEIFPIELSVGPYKKKGRIIGINVVHRDISERKRMEEELRESEERFRDLYEGIHDPVAIYVGREGRLLECNKAFKKHFGITDQELKDKVFLDFVHPDDKALVLEKYRTEYSEDKFPMVYETKVLSIKGEVLPLEISVSPYKKKGRIIGIEVIHRDISERKRMEEELRESEERFRNLYEGIQEPVAIFVGREGRLVDYNPAYKKLSGFTDEELKDTTYLSLAHPDDRILLQEKYNKKYPEENFPIIFEERAVNKKGDVIDIEVSVSQYRKKGKVIGVEAIHRDITERKAMEKKLQEYAEHLEEMVEVRTRELKESQERLVKSERLAAIGQLATMVGHDLRNPLTGIKGAEYYLKTKWGSKMDRTANEMLEVIEKDVEYSDKIITDLLEYSREIKLELKETTPKSMLEDALTLIKVPENVQILELTENEPEIKIDNDKMKRVLVNIMKNAIDAMPEGGRLTVKSRETSGNLEIAFTDSGVGMSKETMEKLWAPLFTTKAKGIGLGLSICKRIVEAHGGRISVESAIGEGTTFVVAIPLKPKSESGEEILVNAPKPLLSMTRKTQGRL